MALGHATLLHQHAGLLTTYEHHRLALAVLSLHQTTSHCWEDKDKIYSGDNAAVTFLDKNKDFICGVVFSAQGAL